jgi:hypothetical protein
MCYSVLIIMFNRKTSEKTNTDPFLYAQAKRLEGQRQAPSSLAGVAIPRVNFNQYLDEEIDGTFIGLKDGDLMPDDAKFYRADVPRRAEIAVTATPSVQKELTRRASLLMSPNTLEPRTDLIPSQNPPRHLAEPDWKK